ncbi:guanylate-binding protein 1-like isoform X2 [Hemiscyllium ocellatum]|uniref:guanylate-binding protein 1-like isoform X2 n=1 Tax=Hemiscyllium ocellatum TaxID=170820 RepID=UPI002966C0FD|nr:guanylate-binding protein 1-like isoform X2 [Hemiscyllium ocellatum]
METGDAISLLELTPSGSLTLNLKAIQVLSAITQPVLVVAISGPPNTGKSYLMNRLVNRTKGFPLRSGKMLPGWRTWMWCLPHPERANEYLVILDIDGLEGERNENTKPQIFALAYVLSNIFIYNSKGTVDQEALDKLKSRWCLLGQPLPDGEIRPQEVLGVQPPVSRGRCPEVGPGPGGGAGPGFPAADGEAEGTRAGALARMVEHCVSRLCQGQLIVLEDLYDATRHSVPTVPQGAATDRTMPQPTKTVRIGVPWNMERPVCLIENSSAGELSVNREAVDQILSTISQPVVVVAIAGLYRTGKSYLMNKLAGKQKGFSLGSTIQSHTKGIWMMCVPHPVRPDHCLILLDTEGLGDVEKGDPTNDSWIFALAVLLSSMLVYNSMGTIDQYAMDKLHYVTELTELIKVKATGGEDESTEFARFFPAFVWSVRDFTLDLTLEGRKVTEDGYLENALKLKHGASPNVQKYNLPRECIRNYFPTRKCFVFDRPADKDTMRNMEEVPDSCLDAAFVNQAQRFVQYVYRTAQTKTLKGGYPVTGQMLGALVLTYVDSIRSGHLPCLESAVHTLADIENTAAIQEAAQAYGKWMGERVTLPTETVKELSEIHNQVHPEALQLFMRRCFKDEGQRYQQEFTKEVAAIYADISEKNRELSTDISNRIILDLGAGIQEKIRIGSYTKPGGYSEYEKDMAELVRKYRAKPRKGVQAQQVLQDFLATKQQLSDSIRQADQTMTTSQKEIQAARERAEVAEQQQRAKEEEKRAAEQRLVDERRAAEVNLDQLKEKAKQEQARLVQEHERLLTQRLQEQDKLMKEGFQGRADALQREIDALKVEKKQAASPSLVDVVIDTSILAAPGFFKVIPIAAKVGKFLWDKFWQPMQAVYPDEGQMPETWILLPLGCCLTDCAFPAPPSRQSLLPISWKFHFRHRTSLTQGWDRLEPHPMNAGSELRWDLLL